jgi:methionyl-tRNA formyltransferase|tara:strand:+ start:84 stop:764 length:681 start_codon:yes stop_codon:yes gene_type:complete
MKKYLIVTSTKYISEIIEKKKNLKKYFFIINKKKNLTLENLGKIKPKYIFFPHWRHKIGKNIFKKYPCIGFHSTPLPYGRGGSPIQNMIIRGFKKTKICAIQITENIDAGPIYFKKAMSLKGDGETIMFRMNSTILKMIQIFLKKKIYPKKQIGKVTFFKRRKAKQSKIFFNNSLSKIYDQIRMLDIDGYPRAYFENKKYKVTFRSANFVGSKIKCSALIEKKSIR